MVKGCLIILYQCTITASVPQLIYLVLLHSEVTANLSSTEHTVTLLIVRQFVSLLSVVCIGEGWKRAIVVVAPIIDENVISTSKPWTVVFVSEYQVVISLGHKLLHHVQREDAGPPATVVYPATIGITFPLVVGVGSYGFAKLGADEGEGVRFVVALLMEGSSTEVVFRCSENVDYLFRFVEYLLQKCHLLLSCLHLTTEKLWVYFAHNLLIIHCFLDVSLYVFCCLHHVLQISFVFAYQSFYQLFIFLSYHCLYLFVECWCFLSSQESWVSMVEYFLSRLLFLRFQPLESTSFSQRIASFLQLFAKNTFHLQ